MAAILLMFILAVKPIAHEPTVVQGGDFLYAFNTIDVLNETDLAATSRSPYWWLDSGAQMITGGGVGRTVQGSLPSGDPWRLIYSVSNPIDTDGGYHPQNIFRLVTKEQWRDMREEAYFSVVRENTSTSVNHNESNGLLLFSRYQDHDNLYYAGIRVDGAAVIKKKIHGTYYELAYKPHFERSAMQVAPDNLLSQQIWIGLRTDIWNISSRSVRITLSLDVSGTGHWLPVITVVDDGKHFGGPAITQSGSGGIRTDFMDVLFRDFHIWKIQT